MAEESGALVRIGRRGALVRRAHRPTKTIMMHIHQGTNSKSTPRTAVIEVDSDAIPKDRVIVAMMIENADEWMTSNDGGAVDEGMKAMAVNQMLEVIRGREPRNDIVSPKRKRSEKIAVENT